MKKYFLTGLGILLPLAITVAILTFFIDVLTKPFIGYATKIITDWDLFPQGFLFLSPEEIALYGSRALVLLILFGGTLLLGAFTRLFFLNGLISLLDKMLQRIPMVNSLYKACKDVMNALLSPERTSFKQVVMVPFPRPGIYTLGIISQESPECCSSASHKELVSVLVPNTPNPTTGFLLMISHDDLIPIDMTPEDAIKYLVSCGSIVLRNLMKRYFITGLIFLIPFVITILLLITAVDIITDPFTSLASHFLGKWTQTHPELTKIISRLLVLLFVCLFTLSLGFLAQKYLIANLLHRLQNFLQKIPFVRVIYRFTKDVTKMTLSSEEKLFKQTVLVPFPQTDSLAIGLVSRPPPPCISNAAPSEVEIAVFIPTAPHPISGFLLLTSQKWVKPIDVSTEDAFKYIISCGTVTDFKQPPKADSPNA